jgi:hypothetical protein
MPAIFWLGNKEVVVELGGVTGLNKGVVDGLVAGNKVRFGIPVKMDYFSGVVDFCWTWFVNGLNPVLTVVAGNSEGLLDYSLALWKMFLLKGLLEDGFGGFVPRLGLW